MVLVRVLKSTMGTGLVQLVVLVLVLVRGEGEEMLGALVVLLYSVACRGCR